MNADTAALSIIPLRDLTRADRGRAGGKAANLGELAGAGFPVPDGFVVIGEPDAEVVRAAASLGDVPLAVRSSAAAEDLAEASFAGQYETILDVCGPEALLAAIRRCQASAGSARVEQYRAAHASAGDPHIAVLVQRMVVPDAAGVAFTADPLTGDREHVVITAAHGRGERVVGGEAVGDEWVVGGDKPVCRRSLEAAIDPAQAAAIAALARRVEGRFGSPQDIEWAIAASRLYLLQTRPMTALPPPVRWQVPANRYWMRTLRLGEWLPEPMTPLFGDWLLERIEEGFVEGMRKTAGAALPWSHAAINGWYYTAVPRFSRAELARIVRAAIDTRGRILGLVFNALIRVNTSPEVADRRVLRRLAKEWEHELLPHYRDLVDAGQRRVEQATPAELIELVDRVGWMSGEYFWSLALVGGSGWKMEACLARFCRRHLGDRPQAGVVALLRGLPGGQPELVPHATQSADWYHPTAGELGLTNADARPTAGGRLRVEREAAETECRTGLASQPGVRKRFTSLLEVAQRYAVIREQQARDFTLGWPLLRRCALRLGQQLQAAGSIDRAEDVFFLTRDQLGRSEPLQATVAHRRAQWERQRRLVAPLAIGRAPKLLALAIKSSVDAVRSTARAPEGAIVGEPASPGRAAGRVRIVRSHDDFDRFQPGEVLVAPGTAPAWTPLFARAAAVVTDGGSLAAHASLVAREYGIPAVVGTGDATVRLCDGQQVVVDGNAGTVETSLAVRPHQG